MKNYALAVCFASLLCGAVTLGFLVFNIVKVTSPEFTISPMSLKIYESNEAYRKMEANSNSSIALSGPMVMNPDGSILNPQFAEKTKKSELSDAEVEKLRLEGREQVLASHFFRAKQSMLLQVIILSIGTILFFIHWRLAKKYSAAIA